MNRIITSISIWRANRKQGVKILSDREYRKYNITKTIEI